MEDGPEEAEGTYEYGGFTYRLQEAASEVWSVYLDDVYLGVVRSAEPVEDEPGPHYSAHLAGEESEPDGEVTEDWRAALEFLIDAAAQ